MTDRKLSRFFQGAKVSVGDVTALGRPASEMTDDEVAYICARYMQEQAEPSLDAPGGTLYPHGLPTVLAELWSYEEFDSKRQQKIRRRLRLAGFVPLTYGDKFFGYFVPNEWTWVSEAPAPTVVPEKAPGASESPVKHLWYCRNGDGASFLSEEARDRHEKIVPHETKEVAVEAVESTVQVLPTLTEHAVALLEAIQKQPGLSPKEYNRILGNPTHIQPLKQKGLVRTEGHTQNTRVFSTTSVPARNFPTTKAPNFRHGVRDRALDEVKAHPGQTATQIAKAIDANVTGVMKMLTDLVAMKKVRATGKQPRQYFPYRFGKAAPKEKPHRSEAVSAVSAVQAIVEENKKLHTEKAELEQIIQQQRVELASYAKVKELLGL